MPPRKRAEAKPPKPDEPPHDPPAAPVEGEGASSDQLPGQGAAEPTRMIADDPDLELDAEKAQPSDPTRCGGYVLVPGEGWRPESRPENQE